jgi:hypothetical protein
VNIYLDESGDLGWQFNQPYRSGGSSRHLTIASLLVDPSAKHLPKRLLAKMYQKFKWNTKQEKKWSEMKVKEREWFAAAALDLFTEKNHLLTCYSITVFKQRVSPHIRTDPNKLYNYMVGLSLLKKMSDYGMVNLIPDARSVKVGTGSNMSDYLQTKLWFDKGVETKLLVHPTDSSASRNLQFADMLSGVVQGHYEDGKSLYWNTCRSFIRHKQLYFPPGS